MSVIVWDGKMLAADRQSTNGTLKRTARKIWREGACLMGGTGDAVPIQALRNWFMGGMKAEEFPESCQDSEPIRATLVVIRKGHPIVRFENGPFPITYDDEIYAEGSGRDFAYGAMAMGADARKAVEVACSLDVMCGQGIDTLTFDEEE